MKEKKKGKFILFASFLRPTEELIWQSTERVTLRNLLPLYGLFVLVLFLFAIAGLANIEHIEIEVSGLGVIIVLIAPAVIILALMLSYTEGWFGRFFKIKFPDARYAITSERLFYQRGDDIQVEALENIPPIDVLPDNTLSFGAVFPQWSGLEDAEHIKFIIERAQKERLKSLSTRDDDEYPLEQEQSYKNSVVK